MLSAITTPSTFSPFVEAFKLGVLVLRGLLRPRRQKVQVEIET
jgi:hypothetical protein